MASSVATDSDKAWEGPIYYKHKGTFVAVSQRTSRRVRRGVCACPEVASSEGSGT